MAKNYCYTRVKFGPVLKRLKSFSWTVFFCKSSWHTCETQVQHSLWSHMMRTNNERAYNMNPLHEESLRGLYGPMRARATYIHSPTSSQCLARAPRPG